MKNHVTVERKSERELVVTRTFNGPARIVFEAWTKPEYVTCWWDAAGEPLTACEIDLRVDGAFRFVTKGHPEMPFVGTYREIAPPDRLVFEALGALGRVLLQDVGGKTHMTVEIECRSAEQLDQYVKMGVDVGTSQTLDNLVTYARRCLSFKYRPYRAPHQQAAERTERGTAGTYRALRSSAGAPSARTRQNASLGRSPSRTNQTRAAS